MDEKNAHKNQLADEPSLYLQQHASNPVDWYPWGDEALTIAKEKNKPILLSVGYSACHWCHVMADESFSDRETAEIMNQHFINIKVDREERPDLDKIYQIAVQIITGHPGGWPLTVFLTPDQIPFFGGTYFPKRAGFGRPGFKELLHRIATYYQDHPEEIEQFSQELLTHLNQLTNIQDQPSALDAKIFALAKEELSQSFDPIHGGFGKAPKFPHPSYLKELLSFAFKNHNHQKYFNMVKRSLTKMAEGGILDHIGGGFFRYSVDEKWQIPHFEKMLYDNAQLLEIYSQAYGITKSPLYKKIADETADWVLREMENKDGGYFSTINADSEHIEGKFYYWDREEVKDILTTEEFNFIENYFGFNLPPNFENYWHVSAQHPVDSKTNPILLSAQRKLFTKREQRIHPMTDKKILTSWNALMIKALLVAGIKLDRYELINSAQQTLDFIHHHLWKDQQLFAVYYTKPTQPGYLDDYAFLLDALLQALQVNWSEDYFHWTQEIANALQMYFHDAKNDGFFFTAKDQEKLIQRPQTWMDDVIPSGNGVAASCLLRLGYLTGEQKYLDLAENTLRRASRALHNVPSAHGSLLFAFSELLTPPTLITLNGDSDQVTEWQTIFNQYYLPHHLCFAKPSKLPGKNVSAVVCQGHQCFAELKTQKEFIEYLEKCAISF